MSGPAEILCSRCGTPFPKEKGKTAVTCVVCGQLRPDLDLTLDDDDDDLGAALGGGAGGGAASSGGGGGGGGFAAGLGMGGAGGAGSAGGAGNAGGSAAPAVDPEMPVLRVAASAGVDSSPEAMRSSPFRVDHPYMALQDSPFDRPAGRPTMAGERLLDRVGPVLLVVCPLVAGMAGGLNMMQRTEDFSTGTWYAVGAVFAVMVLSALFLGILATGLLYLVRIRWTLLLRLVFIAAAGAVCYYGMSEVPSHIQVRQDGLPGFVMRK